MVCYYPVHTQEELVYFLEAYWPLVDFVLKQYEIRLGAGDISGDHLGLQVLSAEEFDECDALLLKYTRLLHDGIIHNRRNRIYRFFDPLQIPYLAMPSIEIFEPKPGADLSKLRPGIEHIAFTVASYDAFFADLKKRGVPIDKDADVKGSKFFKTKFINCIELEFRNDHLGERL